MPNGRPANPLTALLNRITHYERLWKPGLSLDVDDFIARVDRLCQTHTKEEVFIEDVNSCSAQYVYALKTLLRSAVSEILVFTDQLNQRLADNTPLYTDTDIINLIAQFLTRKDSRLTVLTRYAITHDFVAQHPFFSKLLHLPGFRLYCATSKRVRKCESKCVVVDKRAYNFRVKNYAWINFNDHDFAKTLSLAIERAIRLPTTYTFDLKLSAPDLSNPDPLG